MSRSICRKLYMMRSFAEDGISQCWMPIEILMDERRGRRVAREVYGLDVIGTARLLTDAKEAQLVPNVGELLQQMRGAGYWIHSRIMEAAMRAARE